MEDQLTGGGGGVDVFFEGHEAYALLFQLLDGFEKLAQGAPKAVEAHDTKDIARLGTFSDAADRRGHIHQWT